jgi:CubicO group peptidase (beta-lactamase class C family)
VAEELKKELKEEWKNVMKIETINEEQALKRMIEETALKFSLPSLSVSVLHGGEEQHVAVGSADLERNIPATADSIYCIASSTKSFTSASIGALASDGLVDIDKPVREYLPWFRMEDDYLQSHLTLRDALSHRSGLPRHELSWYNTPERSTRQLVEALAHLPVAFPPRYRMCYQNHMYILATSVIEEVSGLSWREYVQSKFLRPLAMDSSYVYGDMIDDSDARKCRGYEPIGNETRLMDYRYGKALGGAGTIYSSTRDMLRWLEFHLYGNEDILPADILEDIHTPQTVVRKGDMGPIYFPEMDLTSYGLAWFIESYRGHRLLHHGGTVDGFKSMQLFVPGSGIAVSALANLNNTQAVIAVAYKIVDFLLGLEPIDWDSRFADAFAGMMEQVETIVDEKVGEVKQTVWRESERYTGVYENPAYGRVSLERGKDGLDILAFGERFPLVCGADQEFLFAEAGLGLLARGKALLDTEGGAVALDLFLEDMLPDTPFRFERIAEE